MREILFRGKTKQGDWVYWNELGEINFDLTDIEISLYAHLLNDELMFETIGQFTGLTDKNGTKIFEGDIVKSIQTEYDEDKEKEPIVFEVIGEMIFEDGCFGLRAKHVVDFYAPMWQEDNVELEVIGNIHDNPEHLQGE